MRQKLPSLQNLHALGTLLVLGATVACGSENETPVGEPQPDRTPGLHRTESEIIFRTDQFTIDPGQERFVCYTHTLEQDLVVSGYAQAAKPFLHHFVFAKTAGDEPEGASECDVLFRLTWEPVFTSGAGATDIRFPDGVGQVLAAGTRVLAQLHLLNSGKQPVTDYAELKMQPSPIDDPRPLATYAFGNFGVSLPPKQPSKLESVCTVREPVELVAAFPHMHLLGTALTLEAGPSEGQLTKVFERNPYDFDDQRLELLNLKLNAGDMTRVTCHYDNTTENTITFGESTLNEMCFLVGLAADRAGASGCLSGTFPDSLGGSTK
jgi:copper type II ascorbate-dependent monooxygenase-like protein